MKCGFGMSVDSGGLNVLGGEVKRKTRRAVRAEAEDALGVFARIGTQTGVMSCGRIPGSVDVRGLERTDEKDDKDARQRSPSDDGRTAATVDIANHF